MFPLALVTFLYRYRWHLRLVLYEAFRGPGDRWRRLQEQHFRYDLFVSYDSDDVNWIQVFVVLFIMLAVRVLSDDTATSPEDATDKPVEEGTCDAGTNGDGKCGDAKKDAEETAVPKKEPSNKFKSKIKLGKGKIELKVDMPHFCQFDTFFKSEEEIDELNWRLNGSKEAERGSKDEDSCCQT
nr:hypothetical protein BaRGS_032749 [Batillaria attramentaria]